jgi:hypothetical protein
VVPPVPGRVCSLRPGTARRPAHAHGRRTGHALLAHCPRTCVVGSYDTAWRRCRRHEPLRPELGTSPRSACCSCRLACGPWRLGTAHRWPRARSRGCFRFSHGRCTLTFAGHSDSGRVAGTGGPAVDQAHRRAMNQSGGFLFTVVNWSDGLSSLSRNRLGGPILTMNLALTAVGPAFPQVALDRRPPSNVLFTDRQLVRCCHRIVDQRGAVCACPSDPRL